MGVSVIVTEALAFTPGPVTVAVYVVVWFRVTAFDPCNGVVFWSSPRTLGVMVMEVAFVELHWMVVICPAIIDVGFAVMVTVGVTAWATFTVSDCEAVRLPAP